MDKIKVNNQVVLMRKFVKQAKIRTIHKCTKQIKFLENRKGNEEQMAKTKRKLQRLLEEVNIIKKINPDSVSKLALTKAKDWKAVLAEKNVPLEERCFAMLANHPPVQESVEKFHSDNSELISKIPELIKEWEEKKSRSSQINKKKQSGNKNDAKNPNKLPIGNKKKFPKSNEVQRKRQSSESLESLPDSSDLISIQKDITEQNFKIKKTAKRKKSSDSTSNNLDSSNILCSPPKKILLDVDDAKINESDACLPDSSEATNCQGSHNKELPVQEKTKSDQSYKSDSDYSLSESSDIENHQGNLNQEKLPVKNETKSDQCYKKGSDESFSDSSDFENHQSSQGQDELPVKDKTKSDQLCKNSKQSKTCALNRQTSLIQQKILLKKETMNSGNNKDSKVVSNREENSGKLLDIRSKLLEISMSRTKAKNKPRIKTSSVLHRLNAGVETDSEDEGSASAYKKLDNYANDNSTMIKPSFATKPEMKSKMKAITMLDLNKLQDVDEIPIEKSESDAEEETDEDSGKQKKDPFFLHDGEPVSESDDDESAEKEIARKRDFPSFKKNPYSNFNNREQRDNSFQKRKFNKHSVNGRNSNFREKSFIKNKEFSFKDKRNFKQDNPEYKQNKKFQLASKDKFSNRNGTNSFERNPKQKAFSQNNHRDAKRNSYPQKSNISNTHNTTKPDDKPLHPSWEAKRKLKEAEKVKFQGKRMVFNL